MSGNSSAVCLDVAVDHRLRLLCKPTWTEGDLEPSTHLSVLERYGRKLGCDSDEIKVTSQLAGPASTGGILVVLQQPRDNHPFKSGLRSVIEDCESLTALDELFKTASCGTLNVRESVSLVDLLPFTPEQPSKLPSGELQDAFEAARLTICAKRPDVVLCAGKIWLPYENRNLRRGSANQEKSDIKGELWKLECAGVGQPDKFDIVRLRGSGRELVRMPKVNGFHPSYAVNYHPEHTSLKQLLLLNVLKTCGTCRDDWNEEAWMNTLRAECRDLVARLRDEKQVLGRSRTLSDYAQIYSTVQKEFLNSIEKIERSHDRLAQDLYDDVVDSRLSYKCNDASIVLRKMSEMRTTDRQAVGDVSLEIRRLVAGFNKKPLQSQGLRLNEIVKTGMMNLNACFTECVEDKSPSYRFSLEKLADVFLQMACSIEDLLGDLLKAETGGYKGAELSAQFTRTFQSLNL